MMRIAWLAFLALAACAPGRATTPAAAYRSSWDQFLVWSGLNGVIGQACLRRVAPEGRDAYYEQVASADCYRFDPPQRFEGIWLDEFEGQEFLTPAQYARHDASDTYDRTWLSMQAIRERYALRMRARDPVVMRMFPVHAGLPDGLWSDSGKAFRIRFIGRRTTYPGAYGHMSGSRQLILVDRLEALEPVSN